MTNQEPRTKAIELGLGLIGIGRPWVHAEVPSERVVRDVLHQAVMLGIRLFDTAPSYGMSELRLGAFLRDCSMETRSSILVATKFGEYWDASRGQAVTDHSYDTLCRGIDESLEHLGTIDLLQVHKASVQVLRSDDVRRALEHALSCGVRRLGASVADVEAGELAASSGTLHCLQFPFSRQRKALAPLFAVSRQARMAVMINRPLATGALVGGPGAQPIVDALRFVLEQDFEGHVLTGTTVPAHLAETARAFRLAQGLCGNVPGTTPG